MGVILALGIGYAIGARAGSKDLDTVVQSLKAVRESDEFKELMVAVRSHLGGTLRELANVVDGRTAESSTTEDLVERVRHLIGRDLSPS
jgi:hypothetical protein